MKHGPRRLKGRKHDWDREKKTFVPRPKRKIIDQGDVRKVKAMLATPKAPAIETEKFDMSQYRPLKGRILVHIGQEIPVEKGVVIPEAHRAYEQQKRVVLVGPDVHDVKVGQMVILARNAHQKPVHIDGKAIHALVWGYDVWAIIEP